MNINLDYHNLFDYLIDTKLYQKKDIDNMKINYRLSNNFNWVIYLSKNKYFIIVKQTPDFNFTELHINNKIVQEWYIYNFLLSIDSSHFILTFMPDIIYFDQKKSTLIYKIYDEYYSLKTYVEELKESQDLDLIAELIGITLGKIHYETINHKEYLTLTKKNLTNILDYQVSYPDYLYNQLINFLQPENLKKTPTQAWRFLGMFHTSQTIRETVTELLLNSRNCCLTHNNIKLENLFISKYWKEKKSNKNIKDSDQSYLKIINWENCSWGDPACDLGRAITIYFLFWFDSMLIDTTIDIKQSIKLATMPFEIINYSITTMIKAYLNINSQILENYPDFLSRVIQFAGLGLIYELLTEFQFQPDIALEHQNLYFYIASQLICKPRKFISV